MAKLPWYIKTECINVKKGNMNLVLKVRISRLGKFCLMVSYIFKHVRFRIKPHIAIELFLK